MSSWQEELLEISERSTCEQEIFPCVERAALALGFQYCAYNARYPLPVSNPKTVMLSNFPSPWRERYRQADYLNIDPTVMHCRKSRTPILWSDAVFANAQQLWEEARAIGLRVGWAQSSLDNFGVGGMLTLARSEKELTDEELNANGQKLRWLVHVAHLSLSRAFHAKLHAHAQVRLTEREAEILKWTADGKSSQDIAEILSVSKNTVDFHMKNVIAKLSTPNKTAAAVRAAMMGLLN